MCIASVKRGFIICQTSFSIGLCNVFRVALYRFALRLGVHPVQRLNACVVQGPFFEYSGQASPELSSTTTVKIREIGSDIPDWHTNLFSGVKVDSSDFDWWKIPDFDPAVGDIKSIWEASRFDWVLDFVRLVRLGDQHALNRLNAWLADWSGQNSPYKGPNWKCGQEASIRVMHLAMAAVILKQAHAPTSGLMGLIRLHLLRIASTLDYAVAQNNNHGTSEAAALFIGGSWLAAQGVNEGLLWQGQGIRWLENRADKLIGLDGSFSQYSLNYHRVLLDTFSMVEVWRIHLGLPYFSSQWYGRSKLAVLWLQAMVDADTGDAPNLGANDGAHLLKLSDTDYRDFRPTVQLSTALFMNARAYEVEGEWDLPLCWLGIESPKTLAKRPESYQFDNGGFTVLRQGQAMAMLRYPRFCFRPSQADALHLDLWLGGRNLLRDAGTYSYNTEARWLSYFPGTVSHNTIQFDDRDQMPRLSRFLFGDWLRTSYLEPISQQTDSISFAAGYRDRQGAKHQRRVYMHEHSLVVSDQVSGFQSKAVLRWRLEPGIWTIEGNSLSNGEHSLCIHSSAPIVRFELVEGWESRYYLEKTAVPVLEVEIHQPGSLSTEYRWQS